ncbi:ATP-binding protein [Sorangium sp. So ce375]|uniref:ATP-binding protein n=1 Tax=Sorangium sp. So ce375 TaxID=3133306 RepID=UPI003F5AF1B9
MSALSSHALAAVAAHVLPGVPGGAAAEGPELAFLRGRLAEVAPDGQGFASALPAAFAQPAAADRPLFLLARAIGLAPIELLAVALAAALEDDARVGRALAFAQAPVGGSRPTLGLLSAALAETVPPDIRPIDALVTGQAAGTGLLAILDDAAPLLERPVSVPLPLCLALAGRDAALPGTTLGLDDTPAVPLPPTLLEAARHHAESLAASPGGLLVVRARGRAEGRTVAAEIAAALGRRALFLETDRLAGLGPLLLLRGLLPVFCHELGPSERKILPAIPGYEGPVLALVGAEGSVASTAGGALSWSIPVPLAGEREALWSEALGGDEALAGALAREHRHGSGRIAQLGRVARHHARLAGRPRPSVEDVRAASWTGEGPGLEGLAEPLPQAIAEEALVLPAALRSDLEALVLRCRWRDRLAEGLGPSARARYAPGVRALFHGPSGTGKTLAVGWLATRLGLPLYRVDLASVISKYIGETEKNLAQLLARAEEAEVVLLFDEADALFGKRTEVKEANDRFANAQTNYLLQRIESFDGITILTSNSKGRFDPSFMRRLDAILEFPLPGPEERRALWLSHLGEGHTLTPQQVNQLAALLELGGGHIRNMVLSAAVTAKAEGRAIGQTDVLRAAASECKKVGKGVPGELWRG